MVIVQLGFEYAFFFVMVLLAMMRFGVSMMFIILVLVPPKPFKNTGVDCVSFVIDTLLTAPVSDE